eukprot:scaffold91988_cov63-Phaeocystis_antarctica.AAC.4
MRAMLVVVAGSVASPNFLNVRTGGNKEPSRVAVRCLPSPLTRCRRLLHALLGFPLHRRRRPQGEGRRARAAARSRAGPSES